MIGATWCIGTLSKRPPKNERGARRVEEGVTASPSSPIKSPLSCSIPPHTHSDTGLLLLLVALWEIRPQSSTNNQPLQHFTSSVGRCSSLLRLRGLSITYDDVKYDLFIYHCSGGGIGRGWRGGGGEVRWEVASHATKLSCKPEVWKKQTKTLKKVTKKWWKCLQRWLKVNPQHS